MNVSPNFLDAKTWLVAALVVVIAGSAALAANPPGAAGLLDSAAAAGTSVSAEVFAAEAGVQPDAEPVDQGISWKTVLVSAALSAVVTAGVMALFRGWDRDDDYDDCYEYGPGRWSSRSWERHDSRYGRGGWGYCGS